MPGALEVPGAIAMAAATKRFDGYVALGCVLRGETTHYDIVANESGRGLMNLTTEGPVHRQRHSHLRERGAGLGAGARWRRWTRAAVPPRRRSP